MDERHRELLRRHTLSFQKDLQPEKLLPYLVSVFDTEDEQEIKNQPTSTDKVNTFLYILPKKGPTAFSCFVEALENKQPHLAVALRAEEEMEKRIIEIKAELVSARCEHQDIQKQLKEEITRWRMLSGRVFNYKKDFDRNGIIHFLGTSFNTTQFVNPASQDNCRMHVSQSSCDQGHPMDILDLTRGTVSCTNDVEGSWWQVDFGNEHAVFATHYTLRHGRDNGLSMIRNWNLEGSHDGTHWMVLRKHENDRGTKGDYPFYTGSWTVEGRVEAMRYFRIKQTGKNSAGRYALCLSGFEIYGVLLDIP